MKTSDSNGAINTVAGFSVLSAGLLAVWFFAGPTPTTVHGMISLDGTPVPWADIVFLANDSKTPIAAKADEQGQYHVDGLPAGDYRIIARGVVGSVHVATGGRADELDEYQQQMIRTSQRQQSNTAKSIPESFGDPQKSGLQTRVRQGEATQFDISLASETRQIAGGQKIRSSAVR